MESLPTGSLLSWLIVAAAALSPLIALLGTDRWLRWLLGEKRHHARLEGAEGGSEDGAEGEAQAGQ